MAGATPRSDERMVAVPLGQPVGWPGADFLGDLGRDNFSELPDPFPLPLRSSWGGECQGMPRYLARRRRRQAVHEELVADAVCSLNALARSRGGGSLMPEAPRRILHPDQLSPCQEAMLRNLGRASAPFLPAPSEKLEFPDGALEEVLRSKCVYEVEEGAITAPFEEEKLNVLKGGTVPKLAVDLVDDNVANQLRDPDRHIVLPDDQLLEVGEAVRPHWDARLANNTAAKWRFIESLRKVGLITFRRRARCHIGAFFVQKKNGQIRLVLDARPANQLHRAPPKSRLATPGALSNLNFTDEWARISEELLDGVGCQWRADVDEGAATGEGDNKDLEPHGSGVDLQDGFYQFLVPELSSWFSFGVTCTAAEAGVSSVYCDEEKKEVPIDGSEHVWACFAGLPMGWSWALYVCHSALEACGRRSLQRLGMPPTCLGDRVPCPLFCRKLGLIAPYVDNGNVIAGSRATAQKIINSFKHELETLGFTLHEEVDPTQDFELVGRCLDGRRRLLHPRPRRMWRLRFAIKRVLVLRRLSPKAMRRLVGHLVDHLSGRRETLCCLDAVYRFIGDGTGDVMELPGPVLAELRVAMGLLAVCSVDLDRPMADLAYCSDASDAGFAVHSTPCSAKEGWMAAQFRERWRFLEPEAVDVGDRRAQLQGTLASFYAAPGYPREFSEWAEAEMARSSEQRSFTRVAPQRPPELVEVVGAVPRLDDAWVQPQRWQRVVAGAWRSRGKIHCLEARAALVGLRREAVDPKRHRRTLLSLGDNLPEVLSFDRGRAKDWELLSLVRRGCAYQVGANIRWCRRYVESGRNPSDADSGIACRGGLRPGQILVGPPRGRGVPKLSRPTPLSAAVPASWSRAPGSDPPKEEEKPRLRPKPRQPRPARQDRLPSGKFVLELFAGCMALSAAVANAGLRVACPFELQRGGVFNVLGRAARQLLRDWLHQGRVWALCLGTPCTRWTTANTTSRSGGETDRAGMQCAWFTVEMLRICRKLGIYVLLENPWSSGLWRWEPLRRELRRLGSVGQLVHMCAHGCAWKKPTCLHTNLPGSERLQRTCPGHKEHVRLQGTVLHPQLGRKWRTWFASAYPAGMCRDVAAVLCDAAPKAAWRQPGEPLIDGRWQRCLETAVGKDSASGRVYLPPEQPVAKLGWEGSTGFWDGRPLLDELRVLNDIQKFNRSCPSTVAGTAQATLGQ